MVISGKDKNGAGKGIGWVEGRHPGEGDIRERGRLGEECLDIGSISTVASRNKERPDCLVGVTATGVTGAEVREVVEQTAQGVHAGPRVRRGEAIGGCLGE